MLLTGPAWLFPGAVRTPCMVPEGMCCGCVFCLVTFLRVFCFWFLFYGVWSCT